MKRLFPDFKEVEKQYWRDFGIFLIMHVIVLRKEYYEKHQFAATSLFNALNESQEIAYKRMLFLGVLQSMLPWLANELNGIEEAFGGDPWPYGVSRTGRP